MSLMYDGRSEADGQVQNFTAFYLTFNSAIDFASNFYPVLSSLWRLTVPCLDGCAKAMGKEYDIMRRMIHRALGSNSATQ
jgi:hypothetical protein